MAKSSKSVPHKPEVEVEDHDVEVEQEHENAPEMESQEAPEDYTLNGSRSVKITQAEAVRQAVAAGYATAKPGIPWIKEHFGIIITPTGFAANKAAEKRRHGSDGDDAPTTTRTHHVAPTSTSEVSSSTKSTGPKGVPDGFGADVKKIRQLLKDYDNKPDQLKDQLALIDTLLRNYGVKGLNDLVDAFSE